ncbi:MAG: mechanosensitive ion channel family protein [Gemmatimonadales bacterium]|nr:MAG: mechanosensitive ion channel family protein [Gemmatimonadales bacterium]
MEDESLLDGVIDKTTEVVTGFGLDALGAIAVLVIGLWIAKRIRMTLRNRLGATRVDPTLIPFFATLVYWALVAAVLIAVLGIFGVETASFVVVLGSAGLAVGLALQGTLANFAAGVMLLIFRPFNVGNWVEVAGVAGTVKEISIVNTILHTGDNVRVVVPNSQVFGNTMKNFSANDTRRIDLVMGVSYDDDLQVVEDTLRRVVSADERVLEDPPLNIQVGELGDSSVDFIVRPWCKAEDYWALRWTLLRKLKEELEAAGCSIPYPQRDVYLFQQNGAPEDSSEG